MQSLNLQTKMRTKMRKKMSIFAKWRVGFYFPKNYHFWLILDLIFMFILKNEIENETKNELKMA